MASITPLNALPANGVTPAGTLTLSNLQGRLTAFLTSGGAAQLRLITMTEGGNWAYVNDGVLNVTASNNLGDDVETLTFNNAATSSKYHVVLNGGSSPVQCWLSSLTGPGTSNTLVAHASSHLAGGSDDLLSAPGTVGGVTPGVYCGTFGPDSTHQNTVPSTNGGTFVLTTGAQSLASKTLVSPVISTGLTASGSASNDFSASTGTFKTSTGAVTIGGGANAVGITSSGAAVTITAGSASTFSTTAGALNVDGFAGVNLKINGTTVADVGATTAANVTLAANKSLAGAAGTGGLALGSMTGDTALPTGALSWAGGSAKALTLTATAASSITSTGAITLTAGGASTWKTSSGALTVDSAAALNLGTTAATSLSVGATAVTTTVNGPLLTVLMPRRTVGTAIASATTIAPTAPIHHITGTAAIVNITAPSDLTGSVGAMLTLIPDGIFTWTNGGNIAIAGTAVVGKAINFTYDPGTTKWYPSSTS